MVGPHVTALIMGSERFYARSELDAWINRGIGRDDDGAKRTSDEEWDRIFEKMRQRNAKKVRGRLAMVKASGSSAQRAGPSLVQD